MLTNQNFIIKKRLILRKTIYIIFLSYSYMYKKVYILLIDKYIEEKWGSIIFVQIYLSLVIKYWIYLLFCEIWWKWKGNDVLDIWGFNIFCLIKWKKLMRCGLFHIKYNYFIIYYTDDVYIGNRVYYYWWNSKLSYSIQILMKILKFMYVKL